MVRCHEEAGGWLTMDDLAEYGSAEEEPVLAGLGEIEVYTCGPWCQGPVLAQMIGLLDRIEIEVAGAQQRAIRAHDRRGDEAVLRGPRTLLRRSEVRGRSSHPAPFDRIRSGTARPDPARPGMARHAAGGRRGCLATGRNGGRRRGISGFRFPRHVLLLRRRPPRQLLFRPRRATFRGSRRSFPAPASAPRRAARSPGRCPATPPRSRPASARVLTPNPAFARVRGRWAMPFGYGPGGRRADTRPCSRSCSTSPGFGMSTQDAIEAPRFATRSFPQLVRAARGSSPDGSRSKREFRSRSPGISRHVATTWNGSRTVPPRWGPSARSSSTSSPESWKAERIPGA